MFELQLYDFPFQVFVFMDAASTGVCNFHVKYKCGYVYPLSYGVPVRERYGSTLLPATREQHDQNCTQSH